MLKGMKRKTRSKASSDSDSEKERQELFPGKKPTRRIGADEDEKEEGNSRIEDDIYSLLDMTETDIQDDGPEKKQ